MSINQPKHTLKDELLASLLLLSGLIIVPVVFTIFGFLGTTNKTVENELLWGFLAALVLVGFCCCFVSAFFTKYSLVQRFFLAAIAVGVFVADFWISAVAVTFIFGWD